MLLFEQVKLQRPPPPYRVAAPAPYGCSPRPVWLQEDDQYPLTREGRLALGLEDDDDLEDWAQARGG